MTIVRMTALILLSWLLSAPIFAQSLRLHGLFTDQMVLQRDTEVPIWGWSAPNRPVSVLFAGKTYKAKADRTGRWTVKLPPTPAGGPYDLAILSDKQTATLRGVLFGDVWLCGGQSNMGWQVGGLNAEEKAEALADSLPRLRLFKAKERIVPHERHLTPQTDTEGTGWQVAAGKAINNFSGVGYFFGRGLLKTLDNVPIGLIQVAVGGTDVESWMPEEALANVPGYAEAVADYRAGKTSLASRYEKHLESVRQWQADSAATGGNPGRNRPGYRPNAPGVHYNDMIAPIAGFPVKGTIFYQGENNNGRAAQYATVFPAMINSWRALWGFQMPFCFVQLPEFNQPDSVAGGTPGRRNIAELRESQHVALRLPATGLAPGLGLGEADDIHPRHKKLVGLRLLSEALRTAYNQPLGRAARLDGWEVSGNKWVLKMAFAGSGLTADDRYGYVKGFAVAGADSVFHWAKARIVAPDKIEVWSDAVPVPVAVRYAWANNPADFNLFTETDLPAHGRLRLPVLPFRTDRWPLDTEGNTYR